VHGRAERRGRAPGVLHRGRGRAHAHMLQRWMPVHTWRVPSSL
jgi:hypothetical protein